MYEEFYGLKERPFGLTPDPKFLYLSTRHREALENLAYGIAQKEGFILITGEIGTGKTTICRALLNRLDERAAVALLLNPFFSEEELLRYIITDFGLAPSGATKLELLEELNQFLLSHASSGGVAVLIIDEAQNLSLQVLEQIRILSNLETEKDKLLQIALVGQAELREKLKLPKIRQLDQRISVRYHLKALDRKNIPRYIYHRLAVAGSEGRISFSRISLRKIASFSQGIPRLINLICDRALLNGYAKQKYRITAGMVIQAAKSLRDEEKSIAIPSILSRVSQAILLVVIFLMLGWIFYYSVLHDKSMQPLNSPLSIIQSRITKRIEVAPPNQALSQKPPRETPEVETYSIDKTLPYTLHVASFRTQKLALEEIQGLNHLNHPIYISKVNIPGKGIWFRVLIGKFKTQDEALEVLRELKTKEGLDSVQVMKAISKERRGKVE